jgi:predicted nuclease of predicted toxin-antitoxin system
MKFLCDVHISIKLAKLLNSFGAEAIHINKILNHSETTDRDICEYADRGDFVVISKDSDFRDSFFLSKTPKKLIKVNLGNISNDQLLEIFQRNFDDILKLDSTDIFLLEVDIDELKVIIP